MKVAAGFDPGSGVQAGKSPFFVETAETKRARMPVDAFFLSGR